mmetsp:Transcript_27310/g.81814  ORF Transcript_27310/g.81814 Transcript_27310/m.81814 type:complete len:161 (-) Transcript_27310:983-1465(-)
MAETRIDQRGTRRAAKNPFLARVLEAFRYTDNNGYLEELTAHRRGHGRDIFIVDDGCVTDDVARFVVRHVLRTMSAVPRTSRGEVGAEGAFAGVVHDELRQLGYIHKSEAAEELVRDARGGDVCEDVRDNAEPDPPHIGDDLLSQLKAELPEEALRRLSL